MEQLQAVPMHVLGPTFFDRGLLWLRRLSANNANLFFSLLLLNALAMPYADLVGDARLYGIQVLNRAEGGSFADDLYLRYGSQDSYSLFSIVAAPVAKALGLPLCFFVLYLVGNASFFLALQRLVGAVIRDQRAAAVTLVFVAVTHIPFASFGSYHAINGNLLTPRLFANALVLFALERMLRGWPKSCLGLLLVALLMHPLMALGGILVSLGWYLLERVRPAQLVALLILLGGPALAVLLSGPLGTRLFGHMDGVWREIVRRTSGYIFITEWPPADWLQFVAALGIGLGACRYLESDPHVRRLVLMVIGVALLGIAGSALADLLSYALPLQAQPFRLLWLIQLLQVPLGLLLISRWWALGTLLSRGAAIIVLGYLSSLSCGLVEGFPGLLVLTAYGAWYELSTRARRGLWLGVVGGLALALTGWLVTRQIALAARHWDQMTPPISPVEFVRTLPEILDPLCRLVVSGALVFGVYRLLGLGRRFGAACAAASLVVQIGFFSLRHTSVWESRPAVFFLVKDCVRPDNGRKPLTVYWPGARINYLWFDLHTQSYFDVTQLCGCVFSRGTAIEGQRRAAVVRRFEIDRVRRLQSFYSEGQLRGIRLFFETDLSEEPPTLADLHAVCREQAVDFLVIPWRFDGLYAGTDGQWFIYDCKAVRLALEKREVTGGRQPPFPGEIDPSLPAARANTGQSLLRSEHLEEQGTRACLTP